MSSSERLDMAIYDSFGDLVSLPQVCESQDHLDREMELRKGDDSHDHLDPKIEHFLPPSFVCQAVDEEPVELCLNDQKTGTQELQEGPAITENRKKRSRSSLREPQEGSSTKNWKKGSRTSIQELQKGPVTKKNPKKGNRRSIQELQDGSALGPITKKNGEKGSSPSTQDLQGLATKLPDRSKLTAETSRSHESVESFPSETSASLDYVAFKGPVELGGSVLSCEGHCSPDNIERHVTTCPLFSSGKIEEATDITKTMIGNVFLRERCTSGSPILPLLFWSLHTTLQNKGRPVSLGEYKTEVSKWLYDYLKAQGKHPGRHPQHVRDIPSEWRQKNGEVYFKDKKKIEDITRETGLSMEQVWHLFANERKRHVKKNQPELKGKLKAHYPQEITEKLRKWQADKARKSKPDAEARDALLKETGLTQKQVNCWMGNHALGRIRWTKKSDLKNSRTLLLE